jgi:putative peptide zinc metalloprotease protein
MNVTRVLNVALPEMPARALSQRPPRMPPDTVFKEHIENGEPVVRVFIPSLQLMYRFPPSTWDLIQLFDGNRSIEEITQIYSGQRGAGYSVEEVRDIAGNLESSGFWYKTPQEKNIQLMQQSSEERRKLVRSRQSKFGDLSEITFPAFNPDKFVTWLYRYTSFIYTWWFTLITLFAFAITAAISITHWSEIGNDTVEFFTFTHKSWADLGVFYLLTLLTLGWHELAHAHTCKHYGGRVPAMGFLLIYLTPAVYTDTTEGFVKGSRYQRFLIAMAGAWAELLICAVATPIWWLTTPGTNIHNAAYLLMLMTGIAGVLLNWNPLMKLDGYHMLGEVVAISDLKEESTAYVAAWVKRNIWGLPVEVPYVPKSRRLGFVVYALLSGAYSYTVLYVLARFVGNVFRNFNPEWSFIPELATAALLFKSRIRTLVNFMKFVYLDKKDRVHAWFQTKTAMALGAVILFFLIIPTWHESIEGRFILEPGKSVTVRNLVPGMITAIYVQEGSAVSVGTPLIKLTNSSLQSKLGKAESNYKVASIKATTAELRYSDLGPALEERNQFAQQDQEMESQVSNLKITSPMAGVVLTPGLGGRLGSYAAEGVDLAEIADLSEMRARVYVPEYEMHLFQVGQTGRLQVDGIPKIWDGQTVSVTPISAEMDSDLVSQVKYEGLRPPRYFGADLMLANSDMRLKPGMVGSARIYGARRSLVVLAWRQAKQFFSRKVW